MYCFRSAFIYLGWNLELYSVMRSVSWTSRTRGNFPLQPMFSNLKTRIAYGNVVVDKIRVTLRPVHSFQSSKPWNQWYRVITLPAAYLAMKASLPNCERRSILIFPCLVSNPLDCLTSHLNPKIHVTESNRLHVTIRTSRVIIQKYLQTSIC